MKITVIGTINKDLILPFGKAPIESFGGIFYDIAILATLYPNAEIIPVSYVGEDVLPTIHAILDKMPNVSRKGFIHSPEKNHKVILEYQSPTRRKEKSLFHFPSLTWEQISPFSESDMIIVNMITGWDIEPEAYLQLSAIAKERMYLDIHFLTMAADEFGQRTPQIPENLSAWLSGSKFVQMNEDEYQLLAQKFRSEVDFFQHYFDDEQILFITQGAKGVLMLYERDGLIGQREYPGYKVSRLIDTTGCGDAFGAAFVSCYLQFGDLFAAVEHANLVAGANTMLKGTNEMELLEEKMKMLKSTNAVKIRQNE